MYVFFVCACIVVKMLLYLGITDLLIGACIVNYVFYE